MPQDDFWNKLKKRIREVSTAAADFTEEQALIGKLKFDILTLKRKTDQRQREIGGRICELSNVEPQPNPFKDRDVKLLLKEINGLEKQVEQKRVDIGKVADQVRSKSTAKGKPTETKRTGRASPTEPKRRTGTTRKTTAGGKTGTRRKRKSSA